MCIIKEKERNLNKVDIYCICLNAHVIFYLFSKIIVPQYVSHLDQKVFSCDLIEESDFACVSQVF